MIDTRTLSPEEELVRGKPQDMVISALNFGKEVEENASVGRNAVTWWSRGREWGRRRSLCWVGFQDHRSLGQAQHQRVDWSTEIVSRGRLILHPHLFIPYQVYHQALGSGDKTGPLSEQSVRSGRSFQVFVDCPIVTTNIHPGRPCFKSLPAVVHSPALWGRTFILKGQTEIKSSAQSQVLYERLGFEPSSTDLDPGSMTLGVIFYLNQNFANVFFLWHLLPKKLLGNWGYVAIVITFLLLRQNAIIKSSLRKEGLFWIMVPGG